MPHIVVLGGGLVGRVVALDLAKETRFEVTVVDRDEALIASLGAEGLGTRRVDLAHQPALTAAVKDADVVVGAVPGHLGYHVLHTVIEVGKPIVDIAFMPEDALTLDDLARSRGVTAVIDCGVAPGLSNLLCGRAAKLLDEVQQVSILVGGLPARRVWPWEYRVVFSPVDVIEEYTRPARWIEHGAVVSKPALTDVELVDLPRVGTLEAFNTDGLRSLAFTLKAPFMKEKTLRYPGHAEKMRMLREAGFFSPDPISVAGQRVKPVEVTTQLLVQAWRLPPGEADLTVLQVQVRGRSGERETSYTWDLYDEYDPVTGFTSMARTTGYPCAIVTRLLATGELRQPGVLPPELLAADDRFFARMMEELAQRGVSLTFAVS